MGFCMVRFDRAPPHGTLLDAVNVDTNETMFVFEWTRCDFPFACCPPHREQSAAREQVRHINDDEVTVISNVSIINLIVTADS